MATENGFESGNNNDALTAGPGNSGFDVVSFTAGTGVISTAWAMFGTRSGLFTATSGSGVCYGQKTITTTSNFSLRFFLRISAFASADVWIANLLNAGSQKMSLELTTLGAIRIRDDAQTNIFTSATLSLSTDYRVEFFATQNASTGTCRLIIYSGNSMTVVSDSTLLTGRNTGDLQYTNFRLGAKTSTGTNTATVAIDNWAYDDVNAALIGPVPGSATLNAGTSLNEREYWGPLSGLTPVQNYSLADLRMQVAGENELAYYQGLNSGEEVYESLSDNLRRWWEARLSLPNSGLSFNDLRSRYYANPV